MQKLELKTVIPMNNQTEPPDTRIANITVNKDAVQFFYEGKTVDKCFLRIGGTLFEVLCTYEYLRDKL